MVDALGMFHSFDSFPVDAGTVAQDVGQNFYSFQVDSAFNLYDCSVSAALWFPNLVFLNLRKSSGDVTVFRPTYILQ
jgi:hypothetical protein